MSQEAERRKIGEITEGQEPLQMGGHHERERGPLLDSSVDELAGVEAFEDEDLAPRQQRAS